MPEDNHAKDAVLTKAVKSLLKQLRDKWIEALIASIATLGIAGIGFFAKGGIESLKGYLADMSNISEIEAISIAKEQIGANVHDAIPFKNRDSRQQFIAVIASELNNKKNNDLYESYLTIYVLEGTDEIYELKKTGMKAFDIYQYLLLDGSSENVHPNENKKYLRSLFGVFDVNDDGNKEIYSIFKTGTTAGGHSLNVKIQVYDVLIKQMYNAIANTYTGDPTAYVQFSKNISDKRELREWLNQKINNVVGINEASKFLSRYDLAVQDWIHTNGKGFYKGKLKIHEFGGKIPESGSSLACVIDDVDFMWVSYFKGALFGYNKSRDAYFVVYVPKISHIWVDTMISGQQYLWLAISADNGIVVFNKQTKTLENIFIPELKQEHLIELYNVKTSRLAESLRVNKSMLYLGNTLLTLPKIINPKVEFKAANFCDR